MHCVARIVIAAMAAAMSFQSAVADSVPAPRVPPEQQDGAKMPTAREVLTDAAIIAAIIAVSITAYKAMGKPCACPEDTMRNGRKCGSNSAWARPGGYKPLCYVGDVTPVMIEDYRKRNAVPRMK